MGESTVQSRYGVAKNARRRRLTPPHALRVSAAALLVAALACFSLTLVRITFDQASIDQIRQLAPNVGEPPASCFSDGLVAYTGVGLMLNSAPAVNNACLSNVRDAGDARLGAQPAAIAAALLTLAALVLVALGRRGHRPLVAGICLTSALLLAFNNLRFFDAFEAHFSEATPTGGPSLLQSQSSTGFWVLTGVLLLVALACLGYDAARLGRRALTPIAG